MKQLLFFVIFCACMNLILSAQTTTPAKPAGANTSDPATPKDKTIQENKGQKYIIDAIEQGYVCDSLGHSSNVLRTFKMGLLFFVVKVPDNTHLVIKFYDWKAIPVNDENIRNYNRADGKEIFFLIERSVFEKSCSEYTGSSRLNVSFGTMITPFKLRSHPFAFNSNINLGGAAYVQWKSTKNSNISNGFVLGLSLSSVTLDSSSTNGTVPKNTDRPAVSPSIQYIKSYKNISLTIGIGLDFISQSSYIEKSWFYHGRPWIGLGLGVSLFSSSSDAKSTTPSDQDSKKK